MEETVVDFLRSESEGINSAPIANTQHESNIVLKKARSESDEKRQPTKTENSSTNTLLEEIRKASPAPTADDQRSSIIVSEKLEMRSDDQLEHAQTKDTARDISREAAVFSPSTHEQRNFNVVPQDSACASDVKLKSPKMEETSKNPSLKDAALMPSAQNQRMFNMVAEISELDKKLELLKMEQRAEEILREESVRAPTCHEQCEYNIVAYDSESGCNEKLESLKMENISEVVPRKNSGPASAAYVQPEYNIEAQISMLNRRLEFLNMEKREEEISREVAAATPASREQRESNIVPQDSKLKSDERPEAVPKTEEGAKSALRVEGAPASATHNSWSDEELQLAFDKEKVITGCRPRRRSNAPKLKSSTPPDRVYDDDVFYDSEESSSEEEEFDDDFETAIVDFLDLECVTEEMRVNPVLAADFRELIGSCPTVGRRKIHKPAEADCNVDMLVFYRHFITKCICNLRNVDGFSGIADNYCLIFPFNVHDPFIALYPPDGPFSDFLDAKFFEKITYFADRHLDLDAKECGQYCGFLLRRIVGFKRQHFFDDPLPYLMLIGYAQIGLRHERGGWMTAPDDESLGRFFDEYQRLDHAAYRRHAHALNAYNRIAEMYQIERLPERSAHYYYYLPEINCCELLLLLEKEFYVLHADAYVRTFEKYLFFFCCAVRGSGADGRPTSARHNDHPVMAVDDTLYACLKWLCRFRKSRANVLNMELEAWMMALIHCRRFFDERTELNEFAPGRRRVDRKNLKNLVAYVERIPGVERAIDVFERETHPIVRRNFWLVDDVVYVLTYSCVSKVDLEFYLYDIMLKAAVLPAKVNKIVFYSAYWGEEYSVELPPIKKKIEKFALTYCKIDSYYSGSFANAKNEKFASFDERAGLCRKLSILH